MVKCSFCGAETHSFMGVHLIRNSGVVDFFCGSKCRKNSEKLERDKNKLKWTQAYRDQKHHAMASLVKQSAIRAASKQQAK